MSEDIPTNLIPAVDEDGDAMYLNEANGLDYWRDTMGPIPANLRRLYVEPLPKTEPIERTEIEALAEGLESMVGDNHSQRVAYRYAADQLRELLK